jgi:hypothetical protein
MFYVKYILGTPHWFIAPDSSLNSGFSWNLDKKLAITFASAQGAYTFILNDKLLTMFLKSRFIIVVDDNDVSIANVQQANNSPPLSNYGWFGSGIINAASCGSPPVNHSASTAKKTTSSAVNDLICPTCGNDHYSRAEANSGIPCWRCGNKP